MFWSELHLGAPLPEWGPLGEQRRELLRHALEEAVDVAFSKKVDAVLCSGDLFDRPDPDPEIAQFALSHFAHLVDEGIALVLLPGRYDSLAHPHSFYNGDLPKNIHVVKWPRGKRTEIETRNGLLQLYSLAWRPGTTPESYWQDLSREPGVEGAHVGLLHAHAPWSKTPLANGLSVNLEDVEASGLDMLLLGGPHNYRTQAAGATRVVAPGTPTGLGFGEWGDRYWCVASLEGNTVSLDTIVRDVPSVERIQVEVNPEWSLKKLSEVVISQVPEGSLVEVRLTGKSTSPLTRDAVMEALAPRNCVSEVVDEVDLVLPGTNDSSVRGMFIAAMRRRMASEGDDRQALLRRALKHGLKAAAGRGVVHAD